MRLYLGRPTLRGSYSRAPTLTANHARNLLAGRRRTERWRPTRDAAWRAIEPLVQPGARVAVVGAGNGDDLPLRRIALRASELTLVDIDRRAIRRGIGRLPRALRGRVRAITHDVTAGESDRLIAAAVSGLVPHASVAQAVPLPGGPYDLVIGDLLYSQLLYPALLDLHVPPATRAAFLAHHAPALVQGVVARLHASAPGRPVLHLHDALGWWEDHVQPMTADEIVALAGRDARAAWAVVEGGRGPRESDPRAALARVGIQPQAESMWTWPFSEQVTYLVCATVGCGPVACATVAPGGHDGAADGRRGGSSATPRPDGPPRDAGRDGPSVA